MASDSVRTFGRRCIMIPSLCNRSGSSTAPSTTDAQEAKSSKRLIGLLETAVESRCLPHQTTATSATIAEKSSIPWTWRSAPSDRAPETRRGATAAGGHAWRRRRGQCFLPRIAQPCRQLLAAPSRAFAAVTSETGTRRPQHIPVDDLPHVPDLLRPLGAGIPATSSLHTETIQTGAELLPTVPPTPHRYRYRSPGRAAGACEDNAEQLPSVPAPWSVG